MGRSVTDTVLEAPRRRRATPERWAKSAASMVNVRLRTLAAAVAARSKVACSPRIGVVLGEEGGVDGDPNGTGTDPHDTGP